MTRLALLAFVLATTAAAAQTPASDSQARRVGDRIKALQQEAERLATQSRTLLVELRQLEVERDLRTQQAEQAEDAVAAAQQDVQDTTARIAALEQLRESQLPDLRAQLVDLYKRRHTGYAQLLFSAGNLRDFARASRAIAALSSIKRRCVRSSISATWRRPGRANSRPCSRRQPGRARPPSGRFRREAHCSRGSTRSAI